MRSYCNPLNLEYKYQHYSHQASREGADPTLIYFKGCYYLFASMSGGFYYSEDMLHWKWHENRGLDLYRYAPDVRQVGDWLVFCASDRGENSAFWRTKDPLSDCFEKVSEPFAFWDPNTFQDDDGRVYFYWGCDSGKPIYGVELDPEKLIPVGKKKELIFGDTENHGWERRSYPGMPKQKNTFVMKLLYLLMALSGRGKNVPFIEGAFMNKIGGKYYLQYAAPATEIATYGDGVYIGESPMGPFTYQAHNPISAKPGGFITGAGHGSTIQDEYGNYWHTATMRISVNANFERRVGLFPAGVDEDGILYCNQNFADWPVKVPKGRFDARSLKPQWMLLSYKKQAEASSSAKGHGPEMALNEDIRTCWCVADEDNCTRRNDGDQGGRGRQSAGGNRRNPWYMLDLGADYMVHAVQINFADVDVPMLKKDKAECSKLAANRRYIDTDPTLKTGYILEASVDKEKWFVLEDKRNADSDLSHDYLCFEKGVYVRYLRITALELPYHQKFALSGLRVFGEAKGAAPRQVTKVSARRVDDLTARVCWKGVPGAIGYNVRYGIAADKLYLSHMVYDDEKVLLTMLNKGQKYYACVDSFGEGGIIEGKIVDVSQH